MFFMYLHNYSILKCSSFFIIHDKLMTFKYSYSSSMHFVNMYRNHLKPRHNNVKLHKHTNIIELVKNLKLLKFNDMYI